MKIHGFCSISVAVILAMTPLAAIASEYPATKMEVPVLCYHNIRPSLAGHSPDYTIDTALFIAQIKMLHDSGYNSISPGQLYNYLHHGAGLPPNPILITFDDGREEHFSIAATVLERYNFKGVFFIMTVTIGKPGYLSAKQIRDLSDRGHVIGSHTWNHPDVRKLSGTDWDIQLVKPIQLLTQITDKPVKYFAYPYGLWNEPAITVLKEKGISAAFQLSGRHSATDSLYTIRRTMVSGSWSASGLYNRIRPRKTL